MLPNDKKAMIAGELDRSVREIERKISVSGFLLLQFAKRFANYQYRICEQEWRIELLFTFFNITPSMDSGFFGRVSFLK